MDFRDRLDKIEREYKHYKTLPKLMTMPKLPFIYIYLNGKYNCAWKDHDTAYSINSGISRYDADYQMRCKIEDLGGSRVFAYLAWLAVRCIGWYHYNTHD